MKRLYNWFHKYYGFIERSLGPVLGKVMNSALISVPDASGKTALEYACGSGLLTLRLAGIFKSVEGIDASIGMLRRANKRAHDAGLVIHFREGNILEPGEPPASFDYVFVSFALHLFSPEDETFILKKLLAIAREAVIVIDHGRKRDALTAFVEWLEGSYYDRFITQDFAAVAGEIGAARFEEHSIEGCSVMFFYQAITDKSRD